MGSSSSKPSPLAPTFERMSSWDVKAARRLLSDYKDKDLDFGLDVQGLAEICGDDSVWADEIIDAFGGTNGIVNALAFICGAILVSSGPAVEKAGLVFDALDFDLTEQISMDEMTIAFLCCARGFCVMSAMGTTPTDDQLENVTLQAYRVLSKTAGHSISKTEFTKWVLAYLASSPSATPHAEVSLEDMSMQFGLVPVATKSLAEEVLGELAAETTAAAVSSEEPVPSPSEQHDSEPVGETKVKVEEPQEEASELRKPEEPVGADAGAGTAAGDADLQDRPESLQDDHATGEFQSELSREVAPPEEDTALVAETIASRDEPPSSAVEVERPEREVEQEEQQPICGSGPTAAASDSGDGESNFADPELPLDSTGLELETTLDMNAFNTYDYADAAFDSGSGLAPPDPLDEPLEQEQEFSEHEVAAADNEPTESTHEPGVEAEVAPVAMSDALE